MTLAEVEIIVEEAVKELPEEFKKQMENVAILVEAWPTFQDMQRAQVAPNSLLFGLFSGVPKTQRSIYYSSLPDKITIFAGPILMVSHSLEDAKQRIKDTVIHEIGHHFGMSDEQLKKANQEKLKTKTS